jgi:hypothetical protein
MECITAVINHPLTDSHIVVIDGVDVVVGQSQVRSFKNGKNVSTSLPPTSAPTTDSERVVKHSQDTKLVFHRLRNYASKFKVMLFSRLSSIDGSNMRLFRRTQFL